MVKYKETKSVEELKKTIDVDDMHCKIPLFHGTRRYALQVADEDRKRFSEACKQVLSFAHQFYYSGMLDFEKLEKYYKESKNNYFMSTVVHQYRSTLYEYGAFYLTSSYECAIGFAHYVGGEVGAWAQAQIQGFDDWGIELDEETKVAAEIVKHEYKKYQDSEKVILVYYGVKFEDLCTERGKPFLYNTGDAATDEEYLREDIEDLYESAMKRDRFIRSNHNFRLSNANAYTAFVLPEPMFRDGVVLFEDEPDVDKFIRHHNIIAMEKWSF